MPESTDRLAAHLDAARKFRDNLERVIVGKTDLLEMALVPLLAKGHLLIEDVPGVGKTTLARAVARSISGEFKRVQFTSDLLPMDLTGASIFNQKSQEFEFKPGPIFTNILLADEINRATPRTQSALLECMEENQVTVDGTTHVLDPVFLVVATLNPVEQSGTFELPETQLDRFMLRLSLGYPSAEDEVRIFDLQERRHPIDDLGPVLDAAEIAGLREAVLDIHIEASVKAYAAALVRATREHPDVQLGASPRGTLALLRAGQALALLRGKTFVTPGVIKDLAPAVLGHRVLVRPQVAMRGVTGSDVLAELLDQIAAPVAPEGAPVAPEVASA